MMEYWSFGVMDNRCNKLPLSLSIPILQYSDWGAAPRLG
jgi:hypothetical protein